MVALVLASVLAQPAPVLTFVGHTQYFSLDCAPIVEPKAPFVVKMLNDDTVGIKGTAIGTGVVRCRRGKRVEVVLEVDVRRMPTFADLGRFIRCGPPEPSMVVDYRMIRVIGDYPESLPAELSSLVFPDCPILLTCPVINPRPPSPERDELIRQLTAAIEAWPEASDHLTIDVSESGRVQLLGVAQSADEVSRIKQLRERFGWWVQFDVRLLDATPCPEPRVGASPGGP